MNLTKTTSNLPAGNDCRELFRAAYENRYTWSSGFCGYHGRCSFLEGEKFVEGTFKLGADFQSKVYGIEDEICRKLLESQLWEVSIHRIRRSFEQVHGKNTFISGDNNDIGMEIIVGGKSSGDKYRIKNNVVTMVHRHIHGTLVTIYTKSITQTSKGYLSESYSSQYSDPNTGSPLGGLSHFVDTFIPLENSDHWVLSKRDVQIEGYKHVLPTNKTFSFWDMKPN